MNTPPPGYEDWIGMAIVLAIFAVAIAAYRLVDMARRIRISRPKPLPPRRRFLHWDDQLNIDWHQRKRAAK